MLARSREPKAVHQGPRAGARSALHLRYRCVVLVYAVPRRLIARQRLCPTFEKGARRERDFIFRALDKETFGEDRCLALDCLVRNGLTLLPELLDCESAGDCKALLHGSPLELWPAIPSGMSAMQFSDRSTGPQRSRHCTLSSAGRRDRRALTLPPLRAVRLGAKRDPRPVSIP
jgi:hypothetical protein